MDDRHDVGTSECDEKGCTKTVKNHAWGRIKADGWFFTREGGVWCPDHRPEWYAAWRRGKKR